MRFFSCRGEADIVVRSMIVGNKIVNHTVFDTTPRKRVVGFWETLSKFVVIGDIHSNIEDLLHGDYYYSSFVSFDGNKSVRILTIYCDKENAEKLKCMASLVGYKLK